MSNNKVGGLYDRCPTVVKGLKSGKSCSPLVRQYNLVSAMRRTGCLAVGD